MTIGIIVAMKKELALLLPHLDKVAEETRHGLTFHSGCLGDKRIVMMECGIGKVNAAIGTVTLIDAFSPDIVINTGVAAGASDAASVMDIVLATGVAHHDFWCIGEEWGHVPGCPKIFPTVTPEGTAALPGVKPGLICSGELFISRREEVDAIRNRFPSVMAIDMESAAIAQCCHQRGVPFVCMRVISDSPWASHDNSRQYEDFWAEAPAQTFEVVMNLLQNL